MASYAWIDSEVTAHSACILAKCRESYPTCMYVHVFFLLISHLKTCIITHNYCLDILISLKTTQSLWNNYMSDLPNRAHLSKSSSSRARQCL